MPRPGRNLDARAYWRYGFQGMLKQSELSGSTTDISDYLTPFRSYDARAGRWRSHDPIFQPWESTYLGMAGNPAMMVDPWGLKGELNNPLIPDAKPTSSLILPFFGSTARSDVTNVATTYARDTQKAAPTAGSRTSQALAERKAKREGKKKRRKPKSKLEDYQNGVHDGIQTEINNSVDAVAVIPEMITDAIIEIANNSDRLIEIVLEAAFDMAVSLGEELLEVVNPVGYIFDSPYENGHQLGSLLGKYAGVLLTLGATIVARVALKLPKLAKLAGAERKAPSNPNNSATLVTSPPSRIHAGSLKEFKVLIRNLSDPASKLSQGELIKLRALANRYGGSVRVDIGGVKGTGVNPHAHIEGLGSGLESRHIWIEQGVQ